MRVDWGLAYLSLCPLRRGRLFLRSLIRSADGNVLFFRKGKRRLNHLILKHWPRSSRASAFAGLNNGLDAAENERLLTTMNLPEMIALVLRGLSRLGKPPVLAR